MSLADQQASENLWDCQNAWHTGFLQRAEQLRLSQLSLSDTELIKQVKDLLLACDSHKTDYEDLKAKLSSNAVAQLANDITKSHEQFTEERDAIKYHLDAVQLCVWSKDWIIKTLQAVTFCDHDPQVSDCVLECQHTSAKQFGTWLESNKEVDSSVLTPFAEVMLRCVDAVQKSYSGIDIKGPPITSRDFMLTRNLCTELDQWTRKTAQWISPHIENKLNPKRFLGSHATHVERLGTYMRDMTPQRQNNVKPFVDTFSNVMRNFVASHMQGPPASGE